LAKILIIEDHFDVAEIIGQQLYLNFHEVEIAHTYPEAFKKFIAFAPNLVIIDVCLGPADGRELCREIRRFNNWVPILLMSGNPELLRDCELSGANSTIEKPFDLDELLAKVDSLLRESRRN
jgi:DNA-binding response OmpR family regulator